MADPIKWKSKTIILKPEATYGVDPVPTGAANAMLLTDVEFSPMEGEDVSRNLEQFFLGAQENIPAGLHVVLTASFELAGSGTAGVAPAWGPLLRACAAAEVVTAGTDVQYVPITEGQESVGLYFQWGPWRHVMLGARGTAVLTVNAAGIPICRVTLTGLYTRPTDAVAPTPDISKWQGPQIASKANTPLFTIGTIPFTLRTLELNLGCQVEPRLLIGSERIIITDKAETLGATVEAVPYGTYNPSVIAETRARQAIVLQHGTVAGQKVRIDAGQCQQNRPGASQQNQGVVEWPLAFRPLPTGAGNDQWKITVS